jgi:TolA-binding protein
VSRTACPRRFEVEAARDGRLAGAELARFQSHLARCPSCSEEYQALEALRASLRGLSTGVADELHTRRERTRLLAAFNARLVPAATRSRRWLVTLLAPAALVAIALVAVAPWSPQRPARTAASASVAAAPEGIAIRPGPSTQWSSRVENHRETITLAAGTLAISIDHTRSPRRVRVLLPDGELEDLGTTFTVTVTGSETTHVSVQHGAVIVRLRDRPPIVLGANQSWTPSMPESAASPAAPAPDGSHALSPAPASTASSAAGRVGASVPALPAPVSTSPGDIRPEPTRGTGAADAAATDFRAALSALDAGNPSLAATLFAAFLVRHSTDVRAEDAAYLRVIALQRAGNLDATRSAAKTYLERYPTAFRRLEIEPLSR